VAAIFGRRPPRIQRFHQIPALPFPMPFHRVKGIFAAFFLILPSCGLVPRATPTPVATPEREGFFEIARQCWPEARRSGVKRGRLVGVSMGGLGALIHDVEYPDQADELILLSPFVGDEAALREIEASGGLMKWRGPSRPPKAISAASYGSNSGKSGW